MVQEKGYSYNSKQFNKMLISFRMIVDDNNLSVIEIMENESLFNEMICGGYKIFQYAINYIFTCMQNNNSLKHNNDNDDGYYFHSNRKI